ncbi:Protein TASOR [Apodemus speciosus]|uniref:Protein TASOR n=1 Tax=Apodemus speciosus TaxID=105296 RepID=A0ABQ0F1B6_APOSI
MTSNNMEMNENEKCKSPDSECLWTTDAEANAGKKFTIPKIRRTTEKVYLSSCLTNTREYGLIHGTLKQCRLDVSCDLQLTCQFGDTKLVRNEYLEKQFAAKRVSLCSPGCPGTHSEDQADRSEMREGGRHSRELEEHFCFLALPQTDVVDVYQNGLSVSTSAPRILGNPLLGVYLFRHVDVALRHALSRSTAVESIMVFKVLFGRVKKIQPSIDKNKVSLDPSPNFDCHMSRNMPSLKETIELQTYNSMVYFYEYDFFSRPVDKPRQCLPYAIITVKCVGQKAGNGQLMTSLRFPSTGFPKRLERACSLNNCTIAKRIGKGKDATVIFEHFRKPVDPLVQENCPCKALNSEMGPSSSDTSNSYGNVQNGNNSVFEAYNRQTENSSKLRDASQVYAHNSGFSSIPTDNTANGNGDLFSVTYLRSILSSISAAFPSHNNTGSSTVITSKLIKDPRLMKREQSMRNQNNTAGLSDILPFDKSLGHDDSQIKLTCMPTSSISSSEVPADNTITSCLDASCFKFSSESSYYQTHNIGSKGYDCIASGRIAVTEQFKEQHSSSFPSSLSNAFSDVGKQKDSEEQVQRVQIRSIVPVLTAQSSEPQNSYEAENTCSNNSQGHFSQESLSSDINTIYKVGYQMSTVFPVQKKGNLCEYMQDKGMMRPFISPEDSSKDGVNQTSCKETVFTNETIGNTNTLYQEHKEGGNLNSLSGNCEKIAVTHKLQMRKFPMSSTGDKNELDREASEVECNLTPKNSQKFPHHALEDKDNINTDFAMAQGLMELKTVQNNQSFSNILSDAFQEAKDVPLASEKLIDRVTSSSAIDISLDSSVCNVIGEYTSVQRENENGAESPYNCHKEEAAHVKDGVQDHSLSYDAEVSCDLNLKINLQEQRDGNANKAKEKDSASLSPEHHTDNINGREKQDCHANDLFTNIVEMREIKSNTKVEILNSEECFTFNSLWGEKGKPAETASSESEAVEQRHAPNDRRGLEYLVSTFPEIEGSSVCVASNATKQVVGTTVLTVSTSPGDHQKDQLKETCSSESSDLGLVKHSISECEIDTDKDKLQEFHQLVNENSALKTGLGSEIEVDLEECDNASVFQQNMHSQGDDLCEEFELYESLKSRIDWEGLFGSSYEEMETSSFARREGTVQHHSTECNCVSFCSQDKRELHNPIFLPDLQVTITNLLSLRINKSLDLKDVYKQVTESTEPETDKGGNTSGFGMYSQPSGENSSVSCENKFGNSVQESGDASESGSSHSSNSGQNTHVDQGSGKPNSDSLSTEPSNVTVMNDKSKCSTKSKPYFNDTRNKKDRQSRSSKRNLHPSSRGHNIAHKDLRERETHKKRRKPTSHDSSDCFSSLSQGRIKTFSQSERHIRNVLNILNSEASLCKSKHLSRKLNKAVLHLKKAHRRVHTSLQLISKVGQKRKGPLPKAYAIIRNNFWESCDLQGDSLMSERRYSKHFLSKRKYDKKGDKKRFLRFDIEESLTPVSKHRSYRTNRERIAECLSSEVMSGHVSSSLTTFHLREFCDEEQLPESQLPVAYTSQSISQLEYTNSIVGNTSSSELEHFSETSGNVLDPKETLIEKEYQTNLQLCNSDSAKLENRSTHSIMDIAKEYDSEEKRVVCESNPVSLSFIKENTRHSPDKSYNTTCKANTDMHISILDSNQKHILSVDIYEQGNCISDGAKNGEAIFSIEKFTVPMEATSSISTENTANRRYSVPPVSSVLVTAGEEESSVGENGLFDINENEMNFTKHSKLDLASVTEESKIRKKNIKLPCSDISMLLKENVTGPSKRYMAKYIEEEKIRKIEQAVYKKIITEGSAISYKYKSQNKILKEESFHVSKKITTNNLTDSHLSITNSTVDTIALKDIPNQLKEKKEAGQIKVSTNSHSDCLSKPAIEETNNRPVLDGKPKVSALQKELKEHRSANYTSHVTELSQILQRADEAASLQILEEETKLCQNILPLFVEAFERQQDCSVNQILISRKLLVEQNLWNNCRLKLKPCAVDAWVELQMAMETIQFIENKKRFLEGKPTFRSLLWYDESLYSELLHRPRGYQLQSNFYPGFQGRLKYNAFCELQNYHNQLVESLTETKKENNSYYAFLKYKRQINECEAIMKHYTDCFDFCLSVPFACGVNFGDSLVDLETLRKSTLKLIGEHGDSPKVHSYPGKKDHLWIIIEIVSSKVSFIKSSEEINIKICLYGLEHIYFDAAKSLVWNEKSCSLPKRHSEKNREMEEINESAFSKLKKIYGVLSKGLNNEPTSIRLEEDTMIVSKQSALGSISNCRLNKAWLSYPDISCVGEILDQAKSADLEKLQDLTLRCTDHLEILKKYFQMLQEDNIDNIFIMEENVLDMLNNYNPGAVILKPEAIEIYIEIVMISETIHYLKNLIAKKLHNPRFRGMLWFDWSLLPELIGCQEEVVSFSLGDTQTHCLWKLIETAISVLKKELAVVYEYGEASNCSYALHLFYRELKELTGVKRLLNNSKYSVSTYIDLVPHTASVNFGNTVAELEHNYKQFFLLLKNVMSVPQKDFGKMVHIIKVMKTIEHMKVLSAKDTKLSTHLLFLQMLRNRKNALQQNRQEKMETSVTEPEEDSSQPGVSEQTPPGAECIIKNISGSSKKRPVTADTCEVYQEKGNTDTVSSWKKQKVIMKDIGNRQAISKHASTTGSPPSGENKIGSNSSDSLKSISASPEVVKRQSSVPGSVSPAESVQDTCTPESKSKVEPTDSSPGTSASLTEQPENSNDIEKRNGNFSAAKTNNKEDCPLVTCDQKDIDASYSPDYTPAQKSHKTPVDHTQISPSNLTAGNDSLVPDASLLSVSTSQSVKDVHGSLEMSGTDFHHENNEMLDLSTQDCTCTSSPEPVCIQNKIPVLQVDKAQPVKSESPEKCMTNAPNPNTAPFGSYGNSALDVNGTVQYTSSEQNPKDLTQKVGTSRSKPPRSACPTVYNSSAHSFGTSYPYYSWCFYQYSSSNGTAVTHTYQGMTAYEIQQPLPTTVASSVQSTHFNRSYSEHFSYFAGQPQANSFIPGNGYFPSHTPVSYNYQQPLYSQFAFRHPVPQAAYPYPPNPGVFPQVPWTYGLHGNKIHFREGIKNKYLHTEINAT